MVVVDTQNSQQFVKPKGVFCEKVVCVEHYTDRLFMFRITRPTSFRFRSGEFVMIGLPNQAKPIYRAYSIACPSWDEELEFYSIKVPDGPLTKDLQKIRIGDEILMRPKPTGTLVNDALIDGKNLYLFSTGTGIAPFASVIRDPETYEKFETIILTHTCRQVAELAYGKKLFELTLEDPLVGDEAKGQFVYYPTVTQEEFSNTGRVTDLVQSGKLFQDLNLPELDPQRDRGMICGSMGFLKDMKEILLTKGFVEGSNSSPADFVVERAFVG